MRVFLTGGTGFVGGAIRRALLREGCQVVSLVHRRLHQEDDGEWAPGSITDVDSLLRGMRDCQAVVHLVGIIREQRQATFRRIHVDGTANVLQAMRRLGIPRLLHMSALGAGAKQPTVYYRTKWEAEELVRASGVDHTIFRPSLIFGPGDGFITLIANQLRYSPVIPVIGDGEYRLSPISIHVVAAAFLHALRRGDATRAQTYALCGPEVLTYNQVLDILAAELHIFKPRVHLPPRLVSTFARLARVLHIPSPITPDQLNMLVLGSTCDDDRAYAELDLPRVTLAEGITEYL